MLSLSPATELAHGNDRAVHRHPDHPDRCIKVPRFPERGSEQNAREKAYFERLNRRGMNDWRHVPAYFGALETDRGEGLVFELIGDADGSLSQTLRQWRNRGASDWLESEAFRTELERLYRYLRERWIVPSDINDRNIVCQRREDGSVRLWLIDGVSNPDFLPLANVWPWFARQKIDRRMARFLGKLTGYGLLSAETQERMLARVR